MKNLAYSAEQSTAGYAIFTDGYGTRVQIPADEWREMGRPAALHVEWRRTGSPSVRHPGSGSGHVGGLCSCDGPPHPHSPGWCPPVAIGGGRR